MKFFHFFKKSKGCVILTLVVITQLISSNIILADYEYIIESILHNADISNAAIIYIDGAVSKKHNRYIISKIKRRLGENSVYPEYIKYIDSKNDNLVQLADMCAGCIRRKIERNTVEDQKLYKLIEKHITYPKSR